MDQAPTWMLPGAAGDQAAPSAKRARSIVADAEREAGGKGERALLKALVVILTRLSLSNAAELRDVCGVVFLT
eukprot:6917185-Pyramimonas_sp.AAC.1